MGNDLSVVSPFGTPLPVQVVAGGDKAARRFIEFFTANIRNPNTRAAYARSVSDFFRWCEQLGIGSLEAVEPVHVTGYVEEFDLQRDALLTAGVDERHLFEDRVSGSRGERAGLAKALAFIKSGDCLVVWKLDRLGRSLPHLLTTVSDLRARGIGFRSLTEQMDTATPQGEFLFHVFGALALFERSLIQERVQAGLAAARRRGRRQSTPRSWPP